MLHLTLICSALFGADPADSGPNPDLMAAYHAAAAKAGRDASAHVRLAHWCEARGLHAERLKHLTIAALADPKNTTARGLMGLVADGGRWRRPEAVAQRIHDDEALSTALAEYNARRSRTPNAAEAQWKLALWCESKGLKAEATAHLATVVRLDPGREEAWKHLGYKKRNGRWATDEQVAASRVEAEAQAKADKHWLPLLTKWRGWLERKDKRAEAEADFANVTDPRAVPAVWRALASGGATEQTLAAQVFGQIASPAATRALAQMAVAAPSAGIRRIATETLRRRDPREFLDLLIDRIHRPLRYEVRPVGGPGSQGILFVEGERYNVRRVYSPPAPPILPEPPDDDDDRDSTAHKGKAVEKEDAQRRAQAVLSRLERDHVNAQNQAEAEQAAFVAQRQLQNDISEVEITNVNIRQVNARVLPVLAAVTAQDFGEDREAWTRWWADQRGYFYQSPQQGPKPTFDRAVALAYTPTFGHACFGAGTLVRTLAGPQAIETLKVGDQVLTQDTKTGALSFQPVMIVYHNRPAETLRVTLGDQVIVATPIHRFWKAGKGWVMARELKPGDTVRTLDGLAKVASIETEAVQPVFNLEVAKNQSFFVGRCGALVHDNSLVEPTPEPFDAEPTLAVARSAD